MTLVSNNKNDKVMIFIDLRNVRKSVEAAEARTFKLDLYSLAKQLTGSRELMAAYVFDARRFGMEDYAVPFHNLLKHLGFRMVIRESRDRLEQMGREQKEVDVAMACEMVVHALRDHYDVAVVVSGDRDFIPAIQHVQAAGKRVEVAAFEGSVSQEMRKAADRFYELEKMPLMTVSSPSGEIAEDTDGATAEEAE